MSAVLLAAAVHSRAVLWSSPSPSDDELTIYNVTPGISGFIAFFVLALVAIVLVWSMVRHLRTLDRNAAPGDSSAERRQRRGEAARRGQTPVAGAEADGADRPGTGDVDDSGEPGPGTGGDSPPQPR